MKSLRIEPVVYDKCRKVITGVFGATLIIAGLYLFLLLTSSTEALSLKTFLTIIITFLLTAAIPYSSLAILDNAKKKDRNNALRKIAEKVQEKYGVKFKKSPSVNTLALFVQDNGDTFYGMIVLNDEQDPVLKTFKE